MAFRYVHIRPNLPLAIRAVEGVRSTPIRPPTRPYRVLDRSVLRDGKATQTGDLGFEQPERQEEDDKHKPGVRKPACEVRSCYLIFPSIEHVQRRRTQLPCQLRI